MKTRAVRSSDYKNHQPLHVLNGLAKTDPAGFVAESEAVYRREIEDASAYVTQRMAQSPVVLLAGPSASGKTTTAHLLCDALAARGVRAHTVSLDNYFLEVDRQDPSVDFEAPERLDIPLLNTHMAALTAGEPVDVPTFDFLTGKRAEKTQAMRLGPDEVAIFEGIHALNDLFFGDAAHRPTGIYVSARMRVLDAGHVMMEPETMRFIRRCVRDERTRGADFERTLTLWGNVRRGERRYIMPFKHRADIVIDTSFDYEMNLLAQYALREVEGMDAVRLSQAGLGPLAAHLARFEPISPSLVPASSLLREFIGETGLDGQNGC